MFEQAKKSLKPGDAIVTKMGVGVLTRKTRTFWYYLFKGKIARIHKKQLWDMIDIGSVEVKYGGNNKYRRLKKSDRSLNLVGVTVGRAEEFLNKFLDFAVPPCKIYIGPDERRLELVQENLRQKYVFYTQDMCTPSPLRPIVNIISKIEGELNEIH